MRFTDNDSNYSFFNTFFFLIKIFKCSKVCYNFQNIKKTIEIQKQ